MQWTETIWTIIKVSFLPSLVQIQPVAKKEMFFEAIAHDVWRKTDDAWWTTDDGHSMITVNHHEPMAQVS